MQSNLNFLGYCPRSIPSPLAALILCSFIASTVWSEDNNKSKPIRTGGLTTYEEGSAISTRTLILHPRASKNVARSRLFPSAAELKRGNAAPIFLRQNFEAWEAMKARREMDAKDYLSVPLENLVASDIERYKGLVIRLDEMRRVAYRERAGWEYPIDEGPIVNILLPDVQESRLHARIMVTFARAAILRGNFDEAEEWIRLTMGLGKHVGETPFAVTRLVQISQTNMALSTFEELIQHPDADNYYWDLTSIPRPLVSVRDTLQLESAIIEKTVPELKNPDGITTDEQWMELASRILEFMGDPFPDPRSPEGYSELLKFTEISRERLPKVAPELSARIESMSDAEVGLRYFGLRVQAAKEILSAPALLEPHLAIPKTMEAFKKVQLDHEGELPVRVLLSGFETQFLVSTSLGEQHIAMLRVVESLRDYAATHDGLLPRSLADLNLPAPDDLLSNAPFQWTVADDRKSGELQGTVISSKDVVENPEARRGRRYRIEMAN